MKLTGKQKKSILNNILLYKKLTGSNSLKMCSFRLKAIGEHGWNECFDTRKINAKEDSNCVPCDICWNMVERYEKEAKKKEIQNKNSNPKT